jgi:signal-transduction protein with cAMP-binding, CBS, and nucleotidyltransferase domain
MTPKVVKIPEEETVKNAARKMTKFGISSLLVHGKKDLRGIITEKDIVQRVVCVGTDPEKVKVCDVMSEPVIVVSPEEKLEKAVSLMISQRIKKLPVIEMESENCRIIGMLSLLDIAKVHPDLVQGIKFLIENNESQEPDFYIT